MSGVPHVSHEDRVGAGLRPIPPGPPRRPTPRLAGGAIDVSFVRAEPDTIRD